MKPVFMIINIGRSGSMAVAKGFGMQHEPDGYSPSFHNLGVRINKAQHYYGETSNFWRDRLDDLMKMHPEAIFLHLVRDGKDVIKSIEIRDLYDGVMTAPPYQNTPLPIKGFLEMDRFTKICWYWRYWNEFIEERIKSRVRLEDIQHALPHENKSTAPIKRWSDKQMKIFDKICGETNERYGYTRFSVLSGEDNE